MSSENCLRGRRFFPLGVIGIIVYVLGRGQGRGIPGMGVVPVFFFVSYRVKWAT